MSLTWQLDDCLSFYEAWGAQFAYLLNDSAFTDDKGRGMLRLRSFTRYICKYRELSPIERTFFLRALWILPLISWSLSWLGFYRCQAILIRLAALRTRKSSGQVERDIAKGRVAARMIGIVSGLGLCRARCLQRSLALWWIMHSEQICTDVYFGVCKDGYGVNAHAWVELASVVLNDAQNVHDHFAAFRSEFSAAGLQLAYAQKHALH